MGISIAEYRPSSERSVDRKQGVTAPRTLPDFLSLKIRDLKPKYVKISRVNSLRKEKRRQRQEKKKEQRLIQRRANR